MINLFSDVAKQVSLSYNTPNDEDTFNRVLKETHMKSEVSMYILAKFFQVSENYFEQDCEALKYLEDLYYMVNEDEAIPESKRNLYQLLVKLEKTMYDDIEYYGPRAEIILDFLEADLINSKHNLFTSGEIERLLGRIYMIRKDYFERVGNDKASKLKPVDIKNYLDRYIIGQDEAKKTIAVVIANHMKAINNPNVLLPSNLVLLIGPSGCGKTEIMRKIRELTNLPMVFTDISGLGQAQYRGRHMDDILVDLYLAAGKNVERAEQGIVFMDEFDKLLSPAYSSAGVDVHDAVQSQLLTILEGSDVEISIGKQKEIINTKNILFVVAGAFQGIEDYIKKYQDKTKDNTSIGFSGIPDKERNLSLVKANVNHEVLIEYGMKRELAARISQIAVLEKLSREDYMRILTEAEDNVISRYSKEIELSCNARLVFSDDAYEKIVDEAMQSEIGARALMSILRAAVRDCFYYGPSKKELKRIVINGDVIAKTGKPVYEVEGYDGQ